MGGVSPRPGKNVTATSFVNPCEVVNESLVSGYHYSRSERGPGVEKKVQQLLQVVLPWCPFR